MMRRLAKESAIYGMGQIVIRSISVFVLPLVTRAFRVAEVGLVELLGMVESVGVVFCLMGLDSALNFHYWDSKTDPERQREHVASSFYALLGFSTITALVLFALSRYFVAAYGITSKPYVFYCCVISIPFSALFSYLSMMCRIHQRPLLFNILVLQNVILYVSSFAVFAYGFRVGVVSVYLGRITAYSGGIVAGLVVFRREVFGRFRWRSLWDLLRYGVPLLPILFIEWLMKYADRYFINLYLGQEHVGLYGVASKISMASILVIGSFRMAWGPYAMSIKDDPKARDTYARIFTYYTALTLGFVLLIQMAAPVLVLVLSTPDYVGVADVVSVLSLGVCMSGMFNVLSVGLNITKKTYLIPAGTAVAVGVNIVLNAVMIPLWGNMGAAVATSLGYLGSVLFIYALGQRYYRIPYSYRSLAILLGLFCACYAGTLIARSELSDRTALIAVAYVADLAVFAGLLVALGVIDPRPLLALAKRLRVRRAG